MRRAGCSSPDHEPTGRAVVSRSLRPQALDADVERHLAELAARARGIPFVNLVEHLERVFRGARPVAETGRARDERVRFRHDPNLVFHASDIAGMRVLRGRGVEITTAFLGATGPVSPLATFFTEAILRAESQDNDALGAFYDVLHHRLIALCYRALRRSRLPWSIRTTANDEFTRRALAATGLGPKRKDAPLSSVAMLGRARILARRPRGREALEAALALAFPRFEVAIEDFLRRRVRLADEQRLRLGSRNHCLGRETRLGHTLHAQADLLRLRIGPVDRETFDSLLPGAPENVRLRRVVEENTGGLLDAEVEIEILCGEEPRAMLGKSAGRGTRLGRSSLIRRVDPSRRLRVRLPLTGGVEDARPQFLQDDEARLRAGPEPAGPRSVGHRARRPV
jgi:type VI secretion system protein ImpH